MKPRLTALIVLIAIPITLFAPHVFAARAASEFDVLEQGYTNAIYLFAYYDDQDLAMELIVTDGDGDVRPGKVSRDAEDTNLRIFSPTDPLELGSYTVEIKNQGYMHDVTVIERSEERTFTTVVKPSWQQVVHERAYCENKAYQATTTYPALDITLTTTAPMRIEARLQKDGKTSATQVWKTGGKSEQRLIAQTERPATDEVCAVFIATEIEGDAMLQSSTSCVPAENFTTAPKDETISAEIRECWEREQAESSGGCSATGSSSPSALVLFTALGLFASRRRRRKI